MYVHDLARPDFDLFAQVLRRLVPVSDQTFENCVYYDEDHIFIDLSDLYGDADDLKQAEIAHTLSCSVDCVCLLEVPVKSPEFRDYVYYHFKRGRVSLSTVDTESGEYGVYGVEATDGSKAVQRAVVERRLQTLKESPDETRHFLASLSHPEVLTAFTEDPATLTSVLKLIDAAEPADPVLRGAVEADLVHHLVRGRQWNDLQAVFLERDLDASLMTEVVGVTGRLDLEVLGSAEVTPALVRTIAGRTTEDAQLAAAEHFYASSEVLRFLERSPYPAVVQAARVALATQAEKVQQAADSGGLLDQVFAASDALAKEATLLQLASSRRPAVLAAVAGNPRTPAEALRLLCAALPLPHLLLTAAGHSNSPADLLEQLAVSPVEAVRERSKARLLELG